MKKYTLFFVCCLVLFFTAGTAFAQPAPPPPPGPQGGTGQFGYGFTGPQGTGQYGYTGPVQTVTVAQAKTLGHRTPAVVRGTIVQALGGDLYTFRDSSGVITLRIGPREWQYFGSTINPTDTIEISGEVHWPRHNWGTPELHARLIRKI